MDIQRDERLGYLRVEGSNPFKALTLTHCLFFSSERLSASVDISAV
ncbi:hypothetical protein J2X76_006135 [Neorhizobium sp. 2083]|nr:hypothetical protein [Neorhizobium sp. 2083]